MTKTVQLSPAELDGVVTTDERWDASRDVMHHLEGESTISEENTTESESMTRDCTNHILISVGFMNVSSLKQDVPDEIRASEID